ncbi:MAG: DNA polymerase sliding clamp [Thermosphaera sp.]
MIKVVIPEAKIFKELFESIGKLVDEVSLNITRDEIFLKAMDISEVALIEVHFPKEMFLEFVVDEERSLGFSTSSIQKVLKHVKKGENLILESDGEYVSFHIEGLVRREYKFRNLDVPVPDIPPARLDTRVKAQIIASIVNNAIQDVEVVGSSIELEATSSNELVFRGYGTGVNETRLKPGSTGVIFLEIIEPSKSQYDVSYLRNIIQLCKVSDTVTLGFSTDSPLLMEFMIGGTGKVRYIMAPASK